MIEYNVTQNLNDIYSFNNSVPNILNSVTKTLTEGD
jgi:hypothetical protein